MQWQADNKADGFFEIDVVCYEFGGFFGRFPAFDHT